ALDERLMLLEEQVVGIGTIDAANLVDVAEAFGDDERGARAGALQDGIDGDGRAVQEQAGRAVVGASLVDRRGDSLDQMMRRRQRLAEGELSRARIEHSDVGERTADVGGKAQGGAVGAGTRRGAAGHVGYVLEWLKEVKRAGGGVRNVFALIRIQQRTHTLL